MINTPAHAVATNDLKSKFRKKKFKSVFSLYKMWYSFLVEGDFKT